MDIEQTVRDLLSDEIEDRIADRIVAQATDEIPRWPDGLDEDFFDRLKQINRRKHTSRSSADLGMRNRSESFSLNFSGSALKKSVAHEFGHGIIDTWGYDELQVAVERASLYGRGSYPRFSWNNKDQHEICYMLRDFRNIEEYDTHNVTSKDQIVTGDVVTDGNAIVYADWNDKNGVNWGYDYKTDDYTELICRSFGGYTRHRISLEQLKIVDRNQLTPGLQEAHDPTLYEYYDDPIQHLICRLNVTWYRACEHIKRRNRFREWAMNKAIGGGYTLNNVHETFTALHEIVQTPGNPGSSFETIMRFNGELLKAYTELFDMHPSYQVYYDDNQYLLNEEIEP